MVQNSRFAAVAADYEMEKEREQQQTQRRMDHHRDHNRFDRGRMDRDHNREYDRHPSPPPPMPVNSRFGAVVADRELEKEREMREREERRVERYGMGRNRMEMGGHHNSHNQPPPPPPPVANPNSRFGAVVADYELEKEREQKEREERRLKWEQKNADSARYDNDHRSNSGRFGRRDRESGMPWQSSSTSSSTSNTQQQPLHSERFSEKTKTLFIRPELPKHLQPKKKEEPVLPPVQAPLTLPGEDEEAAKARIEKKKKEEEEKRLKEEKEREEEERKKREEEEEAEEKRRKAELIEEDLLKSFSDGSKVGLELKKWCEDQGAFLPCVQKLVYSLLLNGEKESPDPDCKWAEPERFGTVLTFLVEEDILKQVEVLWAIQDFCNDIGFPKINDENLIQAMFRSMYKYDLADADAFDAWKSDMSPEHEKGKGKTIIQTMDWFNWLEEDDDYDDEYGDYDEEY